MWYVAGGIVAVLVLILTRIKVELGKGDGAGIKVSVGLDVNESVIQKIKDSIPSRKPSLPVIQQTVEPSNESSPS